MSTRKIAVEPHITIKVGFALPVEFELPDGPKMLSSAASQATAMLDDYLMDVLDPSFLRSCGKPALTWEFVENSEADYELLDAGYDDALYDEYDTGTVDAEDIQY